MGDKGKDYISTQILYEIHLFGGCLIKLSGSHIEVLWDHIVLIFFSMIRSMFHLLRFALQVQWLRPVF